jgi:hypothetical protein
MDIIDLREIDVNRSGAKHRISAPMLPQILTRTSFHMAVEYRASLGVHSGEASKSDPEEAP